MASPADNTPHPSAEATRQLVLFNVSGRREAASRCAAAFPGAHISTRRSWAADPGGAEPRLIERLLALVDPRLRSTLRTSTVGTWFWERGEGELRAQADVILREFAYPLVASGSPFCVGFPFSSTVFDRRPLSIGDRALLDLEDIGALLREGTSTARRSAARPADSVATQLDTAQRAAVEHGHGAARVLAPAGSGKTKTLVGRVAELVAGGIDAGGILLLAFNRMAASQLEDRLLTLGIATTRSIRAQSSPAAVHCATFNAFGSRYQREVMGTHLAIDASGAGRRALMRQAMEATDLSPASLRPARGADPMGAFASALMRVRAGLEAPETIAVRIDSVGKRPVIAAPFAPVHVHFTRLQAVTGLQSFDDQIYFAVADMLAVPEHREFIQRRYSHILVDEFQDLNGAQLALVDILSRPRRDLFVVGDDDQLIYGWRFADPAGILQFHERMPVEPHSATYRLGTNYRCSREVVESAARLVSHNALREIKEIRPRAGAQEGAVLFAAAPSWAERSAAMCAFLRAQTAHPACAWRDLAVLCRYRSQQLAVALALDADNLPRAGQLSHHLFSHPAAKLVRAYVDLIRAPERASGNDLRLLLNRPIRYVRNEQVQAIATSARPWERLSESAAGEADSGPRPLTSLVEGVALLSAALGETTARAAAGDGAPVAARRPTGTAERKGLTAAELLLAIVDEFGVEEHWRGTSLGMPDAPASSCQSEASNGQRDDAGPLQILDALVLLAEVHPAVRDCLAVWDRLCSDEVADGDRAAGGPTLEQAGDDSIAIGTIHSAKGREYRAVVIPDYDCDLTRWSPPEIEEERRVVYVGVTRARDSVLLTVDTSRPYVHPFLRELVVAPQPDEYASLLAWLHEEANPDLQKRLRRRLSEIETLFPESAHPASGRVTV